MNKIRWIVLIVLFGCFLTSLTFARPLQAEKPVVPEQKVIRHIFFITIEGLNSGKMNLANTPAINGLAAQGTKSSAISVLPADAVTFTASLLTGSDPVIHGLTEQGGGIRTQSLPDLAVRYGRSAFYVAPAGSLPPGLFNNKGGAKVIQYEVDGKDNNAAVAKAIDIFKEKRPFFLGINLSLEGTTGKIKKGSARAVQSTDSQIGRIFTELNNSGVFNETLIVIVGGLSGSGLKNVPDNVDELMVPLVMAGPGLKAAANLPPVRIIDIAPTVALLAGIQTAPEANGVVLWNALKSGNGFVEEHLLLKRIKDLSNENIKSTGQSYRLEEEKRLVQAEKEQVHKEKMMIQKTIQDKENQINNLENRINLMKFTGIITVAVLIIGYILEYFYLKKKFLMFS